MLRDVTIVNVFVCFSQELWGADGVTAEGPTPNDNQQHF